MDRKRKSSSTDTSNDDLCNIQGKVKKFNFECTVENFSRRPEKTGESIELLSGVIVNEDISEWGLNIYPKGDEKDSNEYVSVYLMLLEPDKAKAKYRFSILNEEERARNIYESKEVKEFGKNNGWGYSKFVKRSFLLNKSNGLLINEKLTILCELEIFDPNDSEASINVAIPKSKLSLDYGNMFDSPSFTDCIIKVEDTEIKVHKAVLAARSPVFHEIFNSKSRNSQKNVIKIETFPVEVVKEMLRYIYKDEVENIQNLAKEMFEISNKYKLQRLKAISERSMCRSLSIGNVCERFAFSETHMIESLRECCQELILKNLGCLIETNEWKEYVLARPLLLESLLLKSLNVSLIKEDRKNEEKK
uniref:BTB domain-containing protein n=1 Tax=Strongyloides papillosus TaxID=174720 RepID=A0A0N5CBU0_STREA